LLQQALPRKSQVVRDESQARAACGIRGVRSHAFQLSQVKAWRLPFICCM
jgi:hypothetical protein